MLPFFRFSLSTRVNALRALVSGAALALAVLMTPPAWGQEADTSQTPALPEIAPQEIEIRGQLELSFPSLERQPLQGFNPPPRIPRPGPDRRPYIGTYKQERSELPQNLPDPPEAPTALNQPPQPASGILSGGGGRYASRYVDSRVRLPVTRHETVTLNANYQGSEGFEPFAGSAAATAYDTFDGSLRFESHRSSLTVGAQVDGFFDDYDLYGASGSGPPYRSRPARIGRQLGTTVYLSTRGPLSFGVQARYARTSFETLAVPDSVVVPLPSGGSAPFQRSEQQLRGSLQADIPVGERTLTFDGQVASSGFAGGGPFAGDLVVGAGGVQIDLVASPTLTLDLGVRGLGLRGLSGSATGLSSDQFAQQVAPVVDARWRPGTVVTVFLRNTPSVRSVSLADFYEENPYLQDQFAVLATPFPVDASGGVRVQTGPVQLTAEGGYRYAPLYRYFTAAGANQPYGADLFQTRYTGARIQHVGGRIALQGVEPVQASVAVTYRRGRLDAGTIIPNFAPVTGSALVSYAFAERRGLLQLTGTLDGPRFADRQETRRLPLYLDADLRARYDITKTIGLELDVHNLVPSTLERWDGYPRPPLTVTAGVRLQW